MLLGAVFITATDIWETAMRKLTDSELATRTREANRRRSERKRERLTIAGHAALTVWLPVGLRRDFVAAAAGQGVTINELATKFIEKGMRDGKINHGLYLPDPETADLFATPDPEPQTLVVADVDPDPQHTPPVSVNSDRDAMLRRVGELLADGLTGAEIARRLNAEGHRAISGKELVGPNLLREYRTWRDKSDGTVKTAV